MPQIPHSYLADMRWPAIVQGSAAKMLGLQYQFLTTERLSATELRAKQFSQLSVLLAHCDRTMPFYRERIRAAGFQAGQALDEATWARIPVLTQVEVVAVGSKLHCLSVPPQHGEVLRAAARACRQTDGDADHRTARAFQRCVHAARPHLA